MLKNIYKYIKKYIAISQCRHEFITDRLEQFDRFCYILKYFISFFLFLKITLNKMIMTIILNKRVSKKIYKI